VQATSRQKFFFIGPAIIYLLASSVFPLIYSLRVSLTDLNIARPQTGSFVGLINYIHLFTPGSLFLKAMYNTFFITLIAIPIEVALGYLIARLFYTARSVQGISILRTIYIIPIMVTPLIFGLIWSYILNPLLGIMNYILMLLHIPAQPWFGDPKTAIYSIIGVDVWQWTPFVVMLILAGLLSISQELFEAAEVDGASWYHKVLHIEIPLIKRVLGIALIIRLMDVFRMFDLIYASTKGGPGGSTEVMSFFAYRESFNYYNTGVGSSASLIALGFIIFFSTLFVKFSRKQTDA
jgi:multiple sugar transport system permease protein